MSYDQKINDDGWVLISNLTCPVALPSLSLPLSLSLSLLPFSLRASILSLLIYVSPSPPLPSLFSHSVHILSAADFFSLSASVFSFSEPFCQATQF